MSLYHRDLGFPPGFVKPSGRVMLKWTRHAINAGLIRDIPQLRSITLDRFDVIEIEVKDGAIVKMVVRGALNADKDICLVLRSDLVVTVWINDATDLHATLDESKYERV